MKRPNLPFDLQRRADIVRALFREIHSAVKERVEIHLSELKQELKDIELQKKAYENRLRWNALVKEYFYTTVAEIETIVEYVLIELENRVKGHSLSDLATGIEKEGKPKLQLSREASDFVREFLKVAPEIQKLLTVGADVFGFDDEDRKRFQEYIEFAERLKNLKYLS